MPIPKIREIREMTDEELGRRLDELRTELSKLRTTIHAGGSIENPGRVKATKKTIARLMTVLNEKGLRE